MQILLSIVVITRNDTEGLARTLSSFDIHHPLIQVVVIDGSDSSYVLSKNTLISESISYNVQRSRGLFEAMNEGLEASYGEYVLYEWRHKFYRNHSLIDCLSVLQAQTIILISFVFITYNYSQ